MRRTCKREGCDAEFESMPRGIGRPRELCEFCVGDDRDRERLHHLRRHHAGGWYVRFKRDLRYKIDRQLEALAEG